jgi:hypothetical protein
MRLSSSRWANQDGTTVSRDEIAVKQPHNGSLGKAFGELEVVLGQCLSQGQPCFAQPPFESPLIAGRSLDADQDGQDLEHRTPFASRVVQDFLIAFGDFREP